MSNRSHIMAKIILLAWLAYLVSYIGRSNYSACLLEIVNDTGIARSLAGAVSSSFAICNAIGQLISAVIIKKYSPIKVIGVELFSVAVINLLFPATDSFFVMAVLWGVNGFLQSTLLCTITMIFARTLKEPYLSRGTVLLNTIGAAGGMFNYVLSWFLIRFFNWKLVFVSVSFLLFTLALVWYIIMPKLTGINHKPDSRQNITGEKNEFKIGEILNTHAVGFVILGGMFVGFLRESISLWIPTYMNDIYDLSRDFSVIITAFVPCLQVCGAFLGGFIGRKTKDIFLLSCIVFAISGFCLVFIKAVVNSNIIITLIMFVANAICMTAALTFLISLYPIRYFDRENVVTVVGITNFFVHFGDFISSLGIGWLSQNKGWLMTFGVLAFLAFSASFLCLLGSHISKREEQKNA